MKKLLPIIVVVALLGQGCPSPKSDQTPPPPQGGQKTSPPATKMGFGKLPALQAYGALGTSEALSGSLAARSSAPVAAPNAMPESTQAGGGVTMDAAISLMPAPDRGKAVSVLYEVEANLPTWPGEDQVLRVSPPVVENGVIRNVGVPAGLPSVLANKIDHVQSVSMSWVDTESFTWTYDPVYSRLNWWKQYDPRIAMDDRMPETMQAPPTLDKARAIAAADAFLNAHGLGFVREQGAMVEDQFWTNDATMPCLMKAEPGAVLEDGTVASIGNGVAETMIYPSPCGWAPQEVTVYYGGMIDGRLVTDAGGWPFRQSSVQVSLSDYQVRGGNVQMSEKIERSAYPLISREEAMKRLEAGGHNPAYGWGESDVNVTISRVELAWMRFDSWTNGRQETFYLPALSANGTVDRHIPGQEPETYNTVVPLVADDVFDFGNGGIEPVPLPAMPVEPLMMDAVQSAPAPEPAMEPAR